MTVSLATCFLDPCLSWLVRMPRRCQCSWSLIKINSPLIEWVVPLLLKEGHPLLKRPSQDPTMLDNFHPGSHLSFLGSLQRTWLRSHFSRLWIKEIIWNPFSQDSDLGMGWSWSCFWMISGGSGKGSQQSHPFVPLNTICVWRRAILNLIMPLTVKQKF